MSEDINQEILAELRRLRTLSQRMFYLLLVIGILCVAAIPIGQHMRGSAQLDSWEKVTTAMRRQDFPAALSMAQTLVRQQPDYYYGRTYLGTIYLAMDDVTNAEAQYSRACQLFPNEESEKALAAIRKRMAAGVGLKLQSTTTMPTVPLTYQWQTGTNILPATNK